MINLAKWLLIVIRARRFAHDMECVIHSIHPEPKFKIHSKVDIHNLNQVTYNIDTDDDRIMGCFILIQEAMGMKTEEDGT